MRQLYRFAPVVLRLSMAAVFVWFGASQLADASAWIAVVPSWATAFGISAETLVRLNGMFEVMASVLLSIGIFTRPVAFLLSLHLFVIASGFGFSPTGVRDYGLALATLSVALSGGDMWALYPEMRPGEGENGNARENL